MTQREARQAMRDETTVAIGHLGLTGKVTDIRTQLDGTRVALVEASDRHLYYFDFSELS